MKPLSEIENDLSNTSIPSKVAELPELISFNDFEEILRLSKKKEIVFGFNYQENIIDNFGSIGQNVLNKILLFSPIMMILISVVFSIIKSKYVLLFGVPLAALGVFLTTPSVMKQGSSLMGLVMMTVLGLGIFYCFKDLNKAILLLSFGIPSFLITVSRELNKSVFEEAILKSELVFIYYFIRGEFYMKSLKNNKIYSHII